MYLHPVAHRARCVAALLLLLSPACSGDGPGVSAHSAPAATTTPPCWCAPAKDTPCAEHRCDEAGACVMIPRPAGTPCDDGEPCTAGDRCDGGSCAAGTESACACKKDADCDDDGDRCNGVPFCDKGVLPWRVNPGTRITCTDPGKPCRVTACDPATGDCKTTDRPNGTACDDDDACTENDSCNLPIGATAAVCAGVDTCSCASDADCKDDTLCSERYCSKKTGKCAVNPASVVKCSPQHDTACSKAACVPSTGLCEPTAVAPKTPCDDGDKCTKGDVCAGGSCQAGANTCTCKTNADCAKADDGDKCNGLMFCDVGSGVCKPNPASIVNCPSVNDTPCAHNVCQPASGACALTARAEVFEQCKAADDGEATCKWVLKSPGNKQHQADKGPFPCSDGDACTSGDTCDGKACKAAAVTCKCQTNADCDKADDGDLCNGIYYCDKTLAVPDCKPNPASVVFCTKKDDTDCLKAACDAKTGKCGLKPIAIGSACDDGSACTAFEKSNEAGACVGAKKVCDDKNPCTTDSCDPQLGCAAKANVAGCDDGNPCTDKDRCGAGVCKGKARLCDDGNACTTDSCATKTGKCVQTAKKDGDLCDADGDGCTVNDTCKAGVCAAGKKVACSTKTGPCEQAVCQSKSALSFKCVVVARKDGAPCEADGGPATPARPARLASAEQARLPSSSPRTSPMA